jgi:isopentenyldiphosphate isomerase
MKMKVNLHIYIVVKEELEVIIQKEELEGTKWVSEEELDEMYESKDVIFDSYSYKWIKEIYKKVAK